MAIKRCTKDCKNEYMDKKYGKQMRVFNMFKSQQGEEGRCAVCGSSSSGSGIKR